MHHHRPGGLSRRAALAGGLAGAMGLLGPPALAAAPAGVMVRDQLIFAGDQAILVLILQRERGPDGAAVEAKGFMVHRGRWLAPFWERLPMDVWPGPGLEEALTAWQVAGGGRSLRLSGTAGSDLALALRTPSVSLSLSLPSPAPAGTGLGPHGPLRWRCGRATLTLDGQLARGVAAWEQLIGGARSPRFGRFELWALAPSAGGLVLGRHHLSEPSGQALVIEPAGAGALAPFPLEVLETRTDPETGFALPTRWRAGGLELARVAGQTSRGLSPDGGPAVYDVGLARGDGGEALVFHLQDAAGG